MNRYGVLWAVAAMCGVFESIHVGSDVKQHQLIADLRADKLVYQVSDTIRIQVLLTNIGSRPIYLYSALDWGESASLSLVATDSKTGKPVPQVFIADAISPPPRSRAAFIRLEPTQIFGILWRPALGDLNIRQGGSYKLRLIYHSPIHGSSFGLPVWRAEDGPVASEPITIEVHG